MIPALFFISRKMGIMRRLLLVPLLVGSAAVSAHAQVDLSCKLKHERTLQYESVMVRVQLANNTGRPIDLADPDSDAHFQFDVEQIPGITFPQTHPLVFTGSALVLPRGKLDVSVDVLASYDLRKTGPYTLMARLDIGDKTITSGKMFLDVVPGFEIDSIGAALPDNPAASRMYVLKTLHRERTERLFVRIDDEATDQSLGLLELGSIVRLFTPVTLVDTDGRLHVLHQSAPDRFIHSVVTPEGKPVMREPYAAEISRIRMEEGDDGQIVIKGGRLMTANPEGPQVEIPVSKPIPPEEQAVPLK